MVYKWEVREPDEYKTKMSKSSGYKESYKSSGISYIDEEEIPCTLAWCPMTVMFGVKTEYK